MTTDTTFVAPIRRYLQALAGYAGRRRLLGVLGIMLASAAFEGSGLLVLLPVLQALGQDGVATLALPAGLSLSLPLAGWLGLFVLFMSGRALLVWLRDIHTAALRIGFIGHLRNTFHAALAAAEWRFLVAAPQAELFRLLTMATQDISYGTYLLLQLLVNMAMASASLVIAFYLAPVLTFAALGVGLVLWGLQRRFLRRAHELGVHFTEQDRDFFAGASEFFGGLKLIKSAGAEALQQSRFETATAAQSATQNAFFQSQSGSRALHGLSSVLLAAFLLYVSVQWLHLPQAELLLVLLVLARLMPVASQLHYELQEMLHMLPTFVAQQDWLQRCRDSAEAASAAEPLPLSQGIALAGVTYRHRQDLAPALDNVSVQVPARQTTALVGSSGAGKTTLADVVLGLLLPDSGAVLVDGVPLLPAQRTAWRQAAAYVPQEAFLFPGSVRDNLQWANPATSEAAMWQALQQAAAADFVRALPQGLDTLVGERGMRLSGGERQRLALARALLRRPQLLVLDEATSHLDSENERLIQQALETLHGELTIIVIAHRLSTIRHADQIVVLESGRVVETGDWDALVARSGRFNELLRAAPESSPEPQERPQQVIQREQ